MEIKVGMEVFTCQQELLGTKLEVRRQFIIEASGDRVSIGESKKKESLVTSMPRHDFNTRGYALTRREAVNQYLVRMSEAHAHAIQRLKKEIEDREASIAALAKVDWHKVPVRKYAEDWTPCDI